MKRSQISLKKSIYIYIYINLGNVSESRIPKGPKGKDKYMITIKVWENSKQFLTNYLQGKEGKMTLKESLTIWSDAATLGFQELKEEAQNIILKALEVGKLDIIKQNLISFGNQFDLYLLTKESSFGEDTGEGKQGINGADLPYIQQIVELATNLILEKAMFG